MERRDYPSMLDQLQPSQAVPILNDRLQQVDRLNTSVADWLKERRRIEEQYSSSLRKLTQKRLDAEQLGVFAAPWTTITSSIETIADSHAALASKIEAEAEQPLRQFASSSREMSAVSTMRGNLVAMAKDVDKAQQKLSKIQNKGDRADSSKVASFNQELETALSDWKSQAPYVFENLQALDDSRFSRLKESLTQLVMNDNEAAQRSSSAWAPGCLDAVLNTQPSDEITAFALRSVQPTSETPMLARDSTAVRPSAAPFTRSTSEFLTPGGSQRNVEAASQLSESTQEKKKDRFGGLSKIGTVVKRSRNRDSIYGSSQLQTSEPSEQKASRLPFKRFGRGKSSNPALESTPETPPAARSSPPPRLGSGMLRRPSSRAPSPAPQQTQVNPQTPGHINGSTFDPQSNVVSSNSHRSDLADLEPQRPSDPVAPPEQDVTIGAQASQRPPDIDPITRAQQEANMERDGTTPAFNVNIRDAPIKDDTESSPAALADVATALPPPPSRKVGTQRGRRGDRISVMPSGGFLQDRPAPTALSETTNEASRSQGVEPDAPAQPPTNVWAAGGAPSQERGLTTPAAATALSPGAFQADRASPLRFDSQDHSRNDNQSIRSGTTVGSQAAVKHPEMHEAGLCSSVIETVSAKIENGQSVHAALVGEVGLVYNTPTETKALTTERLRLEKFPGLERIAPNPAFITPVAENEGEYLVDLSHIEKMQAAFKYKVRVDEPGSQTPMLVTPACRIEPKQLSIIVSYSLNPEFLLGDRESITLSNVMLALTAQGTRASGCLSKPVGTFVRDKGLIFWHLDDVTLRPSAAPEKLLARFATESEASGGRVEVRWEIANARGLGSRLDVQMESAAGNSTDPFADEDAMVASWRPVQGNKKLTSGSYVAK